MVLKHTFAKVQMVVHNKSFQVGRLDVYEALVVVELNCLSDANDDVIAE